MAGMSLDALARATGALVSKQAISKYERGQINPSSEVWCSINGCQKKNVSIASGSGRLTSELSGPRKVDAGVALIEE